MSLLYFLRTFLSTKQIILTPYSFRSGEILHLTYYFHRNVSIAFFCHSILTVNVEYLRDITCNEEIKIMKKSTLINAEISYLVAKLGHTDEITICDAGLPIPEHVQRIDLALTHGVPSFLDTVKVILSESQIEGVIIAEEFAQVSPAHHDGLLTLLNKESEITGKAIHISYISHEAFKVRTAQSRAVVRTGECTPYANVIFQAGVVF